MSKESADEQSEQETAVDDDHLDAISDECGCVGVWENLSEYRRGTD